MALIAAAAVCGFGPIRPNRTVTRIDAGRYEPRRARPGGLHAELRVMSWRQAGGPTRTGAFANRDGKLPAPPHDESGHTWHHADQQIFGLTRDGLKPPLAPEGYQSDMPAFGDVLTDDQIRAALAYIKSTWPAPVRARQARIDEAVRKQANFKGEKK